MTPHRLALVLAVALPGAVVVRAWHAVYPESPRLAVGLLWDAGRDIARRVRNKRPRNGR